MTDIKIGIIGGSGLGQALLEQTTGASRHLPNTPFGKPSSDILVARWGQVQIAFLPRHGAGHIHNPTNVPYRANIYALKMLGVTHIIASGAVGSLREEIHPGHLVIPDQVIDKTFRRPATFFDEGIVVHTEFDQPFCPRLRKLLLDCSAKVDTQVHDGGTYVCMEGPQFSTAAESHMHRAWGGDLIGMTCMPEAKLAREAELPYALVALPTDYDCWKPHPKGTDKTDLLNEIIGNLNIATANAIALIKAAVEAIAAGADIASPHANALSLAIWSDKTQVAPAAVNRLKPLIGKYFN